MECLILNGLVEIPQGKLAISLHMVNICQGLFSSVRMTVYSDDTPSQQCFYFWLIDTKPTEKENLGLENIS